MPNCARCGHRDDEHKVSITAQEGTRCAHYDRVASTASGMPQFQDCTCKSLLPHFVVIGNDVWHYRITNDAYRFYRFLSTRAEAEWVCKKKNIEAEIYDD